MLSLKTFRLYLQASDGGDSPRSTTAVLDVRLFRSSNSKSPLLTQHRFISTDSGLVSHPPVYQKPDASFPILQLRQQPPNPHQASDYTEEHEPDEQFIASESLVIIAVMVAAVAALLFIVVLLAAACMRKRISGSGVDERSNTMEGEPMRMHKADERKQFELRFAPPAGNNMMIDRGGDLGGNAKESGYGGGGCMGNTGCMKLQDNNSTYVTVTRNSLRRDNNGTLSFPSGKGFLFLFESEKLSMIAISLNFIRNTKKL